MSAVPPPSLAPGSSAEAQAAAFADDPRIYFSKETQTWYFEKDDDTTLEYDLAKSAWVPVLDEDLVSRQQAAYSVAGVDESVPAAPVLKRENKKRKVEDYTSATPDVSNKRGKDEKGKPERKPKNTAVFVSGLPVDTDQDEVLERFSRCGVIEEDERGDPKIKMYALDDGSFSGEALVVFFKEESVSLAVNLLDEAELRLGDRSTIMKVSKADFAHKTQHTSADNKPRKVIDKKKTTKRIGKMQRKLDEWGADDGFGPQPDANDVLRPQVKDSRLVVLRNMFTLEDLANDPTLLLELKEDVREGCAEFGEVTNVVLYDKEEEGVITVKFKDPLSAQACVLKNNGRHFDGRKIAAELFTGKQKFRKSGTGDEDEEERRQNFEKWLEQQ